MFARNHAQYWDAGEALLKCSPPSMNPGSGHGHILLLFHRQGGRKEPEASLGDCGGPGRERGMWARAAGKWTKACVGMRLDTACVGTVSTRLYGPPSCSMGPPGRADVLAWAPVRSVSTVSTIPGIGPGLGQSSSAFHTAGFRQSRDRRTCAGGGESQLWQIRLRTVCGMAVRQPCVEALWVRENGARQAVA